MLVYVKHLRRVEIPDTITEELQRNKAEKSQYEEQKICTGASLHILPCDNIQ